MMKYRAVIKQTGDWWIGWLVDLPASTRRGAGVVESLRIGAQEMLETEVPFEADTVMTTVEMPTPAWAFGRRLWKASWRGRDTHACMGV